MNLEIAVLRCTSEVMSIKFTTSAIYNFILGNVEKEDVCDMVLDSSTALEFEHAVDRQVRNTSSCLFLLSFISYILNSIGTS